MVLGPMTRPGDQKVDFTPDSAGDKCFLSVLFLGSFPDVWG